MRRASLLALTVIAKAITTTITMVAVTIGLLGPSGSVARAQGVPDQSGSGSTFKAMDTSTAIRRAYPGGRDDSDLTVQPKKRITKKETDFDRYDVESESEPESSSGDEGFGE